MSFLLDTSTTKAEAIILAFRIAHENGIAGYAVEYKNGWMAFDRKPLLRYGKVIECQANGREYLA